MATAGPPPPTADGAARAAGLARWTFPTPVGEVIVTCGPHGVTSVGISRSPDRPGPAAVGRSTAPVGPGPAHAILDLALTQLTEYFRGQRRVFTVPVDLSRLSPTHRRVLATLSSSAGYGQTITYGALAGRAGLAGGASVPARTVGQIMGANPCPLLVPCHRVVAGTGLGGYSGGAGLEVKRWLLIFEGAIPATLDWDRRGLAAAG